MSKHTPGPWWIDWNVSRLDIFSSDAATLVATLRRSTLSEGIDETARANARLIAAAPELLELLQYLMEIRDQCFIPNDGNWWDNKTRAVIAKATGENK